MPILEQILVIHAIVVYIAIYYHHFALNIPLVPKFHGGIDNYYLFIAKKTI